MQARVVLDRPVVRGRALSALAAAILSLALLAVPARAQSAASAEPFDLILRGGRVLDGTGNPWFRADVGIRGDRIAAIGDLSGAAAGREIRIDGRYVIPGFIDIHSHADEGFGVAGAPGSEGARRRAAPNLVTQGITTVVVNQDGRSPWPLADQRARLESMGIGPNAALMVGHNSIRAIALGDDFTRPATDAEVRRMTEMVEQGMSEGAFGLSAGLEYVPGRWSETSELFPLVEAAGRGGGVYIVHERSSGLTPMWFWPSRDEAGPPTMIETIQEDIEIAERTGVTTVATHIKARGSDFWGAGRVLIDLIERARARGVPIWADSYPYNTTGSDGSTVLIPGWVFTRARETGQGLVPPAVALEEALADPTTAELVRADIAHEVGRRGGPENLVVMDAPDRSLVGKSIADLMGERDASATDVAISLQLEGNRERRGGVALRGFSLAEIDVEAFASRPWVATASDAGVALPGDGPVHARYYGTFPRKIRRYALDGSATSLESAVRSGTSLPAQILGLVDRGMVREGFYADLAVLDLDAIRDEATFFEPHQYPSGVDYVLVGGALVVDGGEPNFTLPGRILTPDVDGKGASAPVP